MSRESDNKTSTVGLNPFFTLTDNVVVQTFYYLIYACYGHFLRVGAPVFLVFLLCFCMFYVHCICIHGLRGFEPAIELNNNKKLTAEVHRTRNKAMSKNKNKTRHS